jgi:hypothetical protein
VFSGDYFATLPEMRRQRRLGALTDSFGFELRHGRKDIPPHKTAFPDTEGAVSLPLSVHE